MRNKLLLSLIISLFAVSAWAADVSVTEKFTRVSQSGSSGAGGSTWVGDVCGWETKFARRGSNDKLNGNQCTWITLNGSDIRGYIKTTNLEGGIKAVSFNYGQFGAEANTVLKWHVSTEGISTTSDIIERDGDLGGNTGTDGDSYSHQFLCKENAQLKILNMSEMDNGNMPASGKARLLVNNITITPYILYRNKDVTIGLKQRGYANDGKQDFINNTGNEGTISYSSSVEGVATVDEYGVITPVSVGNAVITATWSEGASTTYTLHVVDGIIAENFSKVVQTGQTTGATWHGDLWDWDVANVRRGVDDTLGLSPRIQATAMRSKDGSTIISANPIEGGVKHLAFDWRQWASGTSLLTFKAYYSADKENWGDAVATQEVEAATASTPHVFGEDIDNGAKGNAYLKLEYTSGAGVAVIGALKITPYLLYTTKEATLDTRVNLTYTNTGLINNTTGDAPTYEIAPANAAVSINAAGQVAVEDGADVNGDFTVTATWGAVTTTYTLHILSRSTANISFAEAAVRIGLDGSVDNALNKDGHDGTAAYASDNDAVATVDPATGAVTLQGGVGQVKISVSLPQTANYKAASASYNLYVRDNGACKEAFGKVHIGDGVVGTTAKSWAGDLFPWTAQYSIRKNVNDTIWGATKGVWIGTGSDAGGPGVLNSTDEIEGGIKYLSFYWKQWASENDKTLRIAAFDDETRKGYMEYVPSGASTHEKFLFGINDMMRGNRKLYIKNESYTGASFDPENITTSNSRIIIDTIYITPYLLYTTKERTLDMKSASSCTYTPEINNIESGSITYSLEDNDDEASINAASGEVTGIKAGEVTVKATWSEGAFTTYTLTILAKSIAEASYPNEVVRIGLDGAVDNALAYTAGYDGTIAYASSNTAVADFEAGVLVIKGVGQTKITATLPETENYFAAEASYNLYVRDEANARIEMFSTVDQTGVVGETMKDFGGDLFAWQAQYQVRRGVNDTIHAGAAKHQATSIGIQDPTGTPLSSILQSKEAVEGGIKYLSFYWMQWGAAGGGTRRIAAYADDELIGYQENPNGASGKAGDEFMLGINNAMKSNKQLVIKNESYKGSVGTLSDATNSSRIVLDNIYITPYLLYTTKEAELDLRIATTYTNANLIDNTESGSIVYSLENNDEEASIDPATGEVTGIKAGQVTVKATWSEGAFTTYTLNIISITETEASFANAEIHATLGEAIPANALNVTEGYDGEISYASSVPAVASFEGGVLTLNAPGQTKITATLPETSNYTAASASYILTVSYSNYEAFEANTTDGWYVKPEQERMGDVCKWYAYVGGVRTPDYFSSNAITTRAPRSEEPQGYVKSERLSGGISALAFNYSMMFADNDIEKWDIHIYVNDRLVGQLTNEAGGDLEGINGRTLNPMRTKVITGIDEPGMFVIRFENHSTVKSEVEYESGNKGRFAIDNVSWENFDGAIELSENTDNSSVIAANSGATVDVQITRSALVANVWNTLCLPFAISKASDLDDAEVKEMTSVAMVGDVLEIYFSDIAGDELVAGKPYLVKPASNKNISGTYEDKQISSIAASVVQDNVTMQGMFSPVNVTANDYNTLFVGNPDSEGNNLFYPQADGQLRGLRAYFKIGGAPLSAPRRARYVITQTEVTTGVENAQGDNVQSTKVLRDGQLIIIREGKMYNAQGQVIR